ncbi:hypothetical protein EJ05DRAFT_279797 [Pseudovirgaria hyperparasitica]|uniref:DUF7730 domain-containing protein n=1 Tax=Pseudovirgaria hyperparasitica TaxID=470096 RepID=A0A6A6WEA8_9PEZI|nr:uncharacterized protein EJ05DRAFT_279797 [Pseudovirgaria hyperparasitica]KAF2760330.1 hypothetical protein EJ05DRAFT_279797 [Pseudovirgaria hyperparasitica]
MMEIHHGTARDLDAQCDHEYVHTLFRGPRAPPSQTSLHTSNPSDDPPSYVGDLKEHRDFLIDFDAPGPASAPPHSPTTTGSTSLSASWDEYAAFSLFQLPRELRDFIYGHALTPSNHRVLVEIDRDLSPQPGYNRSPHKRWDPKICYERRPREYLSPALLRTCKNVYREALPILYSSAIFYPVNNQALLPLFLERQGALARRSIRYMRIATTFSLPLSQNRFHWAVTCAQVGSLASTLKKVEVLYTSKPSERPCLLGSGSDTEALMKPIIKPLCKIQCPKVIVFSPVDISEAQSAIEERFEGLMRTGHELVARDKKGAIERGDANEMEKLCKEWDIASDVSSLDGSDWEDVKKDFDKTHNTESD